jgi:hypothetical protein
MDSGSSANYYNRTSQQHPKLVRQMATTDDELYTHEIEVKRLKVSGRMPSRQWTTDGTCRGL